LVTLALPNAGLGRFRPSKKNLQARGGLVHKGWVNGALRKASLSHGKYGSVNVACMAMDCGSEAAAFLAGSALPANAAPPGASKREHAPALHGASR
jgi:hypothetical protein